MAGFLFDNFGEALPPMDAFGCSRAGVGFVAFGLDFGFGCGSVGVFAFAFAFDFLLKTARVGFSLIVLFFFGGWAAFCSGAGSWLASASNNSSISAASFSSI